MGHAGGDARRSTGARVGSVNVDGDTITVDVVERLDPGTYTLDAYFISPADGSEQALDDHEITVK